MTEENNGKEIFNQFMNASKYLGTDVQLIAETFKNQFFNSHRTHQQAIVKLIKYIMINLNDGFDKYGTDLRNENAKEFISTAVKATQEIYLPCI
jgi:hypothetical protein